MRRRTVAEARVLDRGGQIPVVGRVVVVPGSAGPAASTATGAVSAPGVASGPADAGSAARAAGSGPGPALTSRRRAAAAVVAVAAQVDGHERFRCPGPGRVEHRPTDCGRGRTRRRRRLRALTRQERVATLKLVQVDPDVLVVDVTQDTSFQEAAKKLLGEVSDDRAVLKQK